MDVSRYLGLPYDELDCVHLVGRVLSEQCGVDVSLPTVHTWRGLDSDRVSGWLTDQGEPVDRPRTGDVGLMCSSIAVVPDYHVGVRVGDRVLHSVESMGVILTPVRHLGTVGLRVLGWYRWSPK